MRLLNEEDMARTCDDASFRAGVEAVLAIRCLNHRSVGSYNLNEINQGGECAACEVEKLRQENARLMGLGPDMNPGPQPACSDCGRAMVWQHSGETPAWMCPNCVLQRCRNAEQENAKQRERIVELERDLQESVSNHLRGLRRIANLEADIEAACKAICCYCEGNRTVVRDHDQGRWLHRFVGQEVVPWASCAASAIRERAFLRNLEDVLRECAMCGAANAFRIHATDPALGYCQVEKRWWRVEKGPLFG